MYQWEGKNGDKMCTGVQSQTRRETPFYFGRDALPERKSCSGMCWDQGGSTPGAEVAAGSSEPMVLFAFFCQGLGSVSQNNQLCCPLVCRHRHLVQQGAELPPQHNSVGDLFREKAGPLSWVWESWCVLASFFSKFSLSLEETSHALNSCTCI